MKNYWLDRRDEEIMAKLQALKFEVMASNPMILGIDISDESDYSTEQSWQVDWEL